MAIICESADCKNSFGKENAFPSARSPAESEWNLLMVRSNGISPRPSEETTRSLAHDLGLDADVLLAMAGKISSDLQEIIRKRPLLFSQLIRELKDLPDHAVLRIVREVRDGSW